MYWDVMQLEVLQGGGDAICGVAMIGHDFNRTAATNGTYTVGTTTRQGLRTAAKKGITTC